MPFCSCEKQMPLGTGSSSKDLQTPNIPKWMKASPLGWDLRAGSQIPGKSWNNQWFLGKNWDFYTFGWCMVAAGWGKSQTWFNGADPGGEERFPILESILNLPEFPEKSFGSADWMEHHRLKMFCTNLWGWADRNWFLIHFGTSLTLPFLLGIDPPGISAPSWVF